MPEVMSIGLHPLVVPVAGMVVSVILVTLIFAIL